MGVRVRVRVRVRVWVRVRVSYAYTLNLTLSRAVATSREAAVGDECDVLPQDPSQQVSALCLQA